MLPTLRFELRDVNGRTGKLKRSMNVPRTIFQNLQLVLAAKSVNEFLSKSKQIVANVDWRFAPKGAAIRLEGRIHSRSTVK